ncbi:MAG TPA: hypothetical protein VFU26_04475 [Gaiellaceae bacterium]|nr:hypothetical protein [Gaiellaceae bacterium]
MSELAFLSPDRARREDLWQPRFASPLARVLAGATTVKDLSQLGKIEVRGDVEGIDVDAEVVAVTPHRALVLCPYERCAELRAQLPGTVVDMTGALAGLELEGEQAMRRLTDLDLDALPAVGKVAEVPALVLRDGTRFRLFFPQEYAHYVGEVVLDVLEGIG